MQESDFAAVEAAARMKELEQHVQQLQQEVNTAGALEYRCEGLQQDKQQLTQQLQRLKGSVAQLQSSLHQERLQRQEQALLCTKLQAEKTQIHSQCKGLEAKLRASEAQEEQLASEQELTSARTELRMLLSQDQTPSSQSANASNQLHAADMRTDGLQISPALAESALVSSQAQLSAANQRIHELELTAREAVVAASRQQTDAAAQPFANGVSLLPTALRNSNGQLPAEAESDSKISLSEDTVQALQKLKTQVSSLKVSRDKLLAEVDRQSLDIERLLTDNAALEQSLEHMRESSHHWQAQAQDNLLQLDQVKGLLEESAFWQSQSNSSSIPDQASSNSREHQPMLTEPELHKEVLQEKARAVNLDVQVKALCMELARARENAGVLSQSIAPTLAGLESRLAQLLQVNPIQVSR